MNVIYTQFNFLYSLKIVLLFCRKLNVGDHLLLTRLFWVTKQLTKSQKKYANLFGIRGKISVWISLTNPPFNISNTPLFLILKFHLPLNIFKIKIFIFRINIFFVIFFDSFVLFLEIKKFFQMLSSKNTWIAFRSERFQIDAQAAQH